MASPIYRELHELVCRVGHLIYFNSTIGRFVLYELSNYPTATQEIYNKVRTITGEAEKEGWKFE